MGIYRSRTSHNPRSTRRAVALAVLAAAITFAVILGHWLAIR